MLLAEVVIESLSVKIDIITGKNEFCLLRHVVFGDLTIRTKIHGENQLFALQYNILMAISSTVAF